MSNSINTTGNGNGLGILGVLFTVLLGLKIAGVTTISWWIVFSPLFVALGLIILVMLVVFIITLFK